MPVTYQIIADKKRVIALLKSKDKRTYRGIATCREPDVFDEEVGKQIAYLKLRKSFLKRKAKVTADSIKAYERLVERFQNKIGKTQQINQSANEELQKVQESLAQYATPHS